VGNELSNLTHRYYYQFSKKIISSISLHKPKKKKKNTKAITLSKQR
jgi:hypothetical protein